MRGERNIFIIPVAHPVGIIEQPPRPCRASRNMTIGELLVKNRNFKSRASNASTVALPSSRLVRRVLLHLHTINQGGFDGRRGSSRTRGRARR